MKTYVLFLKIMGILLLIPLGLGLIFLLGIMGFGIDFNNAWSSKSSNDSGSMYMLILPLGFISMLALAIYILSRRSSIHNAERQETKIREQIYREQKLSNNNHEVILNILAEKGSKTALELSELLGTSQEQTLDVIRELLQSGIIRQDVKQNPTQFYIHNKN